MKKIPTLFKRVYDGHKIVAILPDVMPGMEWVIEGKGIATLKIDGSCCAIINGELYKRYDAKAGKPIPERAIKCQDDPDQYAYMGIENGTYEAIGKHFQGNPYNLGYDTLVRHGETELLVERSFEGIKNFLKNHYIEGIVFWLDGEPRCKIKRSDFGFEWGCRK